MKNKIARSLRYLKPYNKNNISDRLAKLNMFIAYNGFTDMYELHHVKSFGFDGLSLQASFDDEQMLNQWLINDIRAHDNERFRDEVKSHREYMTKINEDHNGRMSEMHTEQMMKTIELTLGRRF